MNIAGKTSAVLRIKGDTDACVLLSDDDGGLANELIIGGWGNGRIVIRDRPQGDELGALNDVWPVLDNSEYRDFWISFTATRIAIGQVGGRQRPMGDERKFLLLDYGDDIPSTLDH